MPESFSQHILLDGAYNLRDVGGYETKDGRFTRPRTLFRSDNLHRITTEGQQTLLNYGLRTIIDLRRAAEIENDPNVFANSPHVSYRHIPLYNEWAEINKDGDRAPDLAQLYRRILDHCPHTIYQVMAAAAEPGAFPLLVHCFVGKDRTGVIVALLLALANVPPETIAADYAQSQANLQPIFEELRQHARQNNYDLDYFEKMLASQPEAILDTLAYLDEKYNGAAGYLQAIGLNKAQIARLQTCLVE